MGPGPKSDVVRALWRSALNDIVATTTTTMKRREEEEEKSCKHHRHVSSSSLLPDPDPRVARERFDGRGNGVTPERADSHESAIARMKDIGRRRGTTSVDGVS